ncbi:hypothetical protein LCGC14_2947500, partial [marine sediment metagenome]
DNPYIWITGSANSEDSLPLTEGSIHYGEKIHIDDSGVSALNWSITAKLKEWCSGSGTYSDPYVIDGLEIDAGGSGTGILIGNSSVYFIIQNSSVYNAGSLTYDAGIKLENTNNGTLTNNNCSNNGKYGMRIYSSNDNTISGNTANENKDYGILLMASNNNKISGNTINDNTGWGIWLIDCDNNIISGNTANNNSFYGISLYLNTNNNIISENTANNNSNSGIQIESNSNNNIISANLIKFNQIYGIYIKDINSQNNTIYQNSLIGNVQRHAYDNGINNHWNNSNVGNYWDNHTSPDSDKDGIVDTTYTWIDGTGGSVDYLPLAISPVHDGDKIHIDDSGVSAINWILTAKITKWVSGSGIYSDPYTINGLEINAGG